MDEPSIGAEIPHLGLKARQEFQVLWFGEHCSTIAHRGRMHHLITGHRTWTWASLAACRFPVRCIILEIPNAQLFKGIFLHKTCCSLESCNFSFALPLRSHQWRLLGSSCRLQSPEEQPFRPGRVLFLYANISLLLLQMMVHDSHFYHLVTSHSCPHLVGVRIVEEIGPIWICLHEPELKKLPEAQLEDVEGDLERNRTALCLRQHRVFVLIIPLYFITNTTVFPNTRIRLSYSVAQQQVKLSVLCNATF